MDESPEVRLLGRSLIGHRRSREYVGLRPGVTPGGRMDAAFALGADMRLYNFCVMQDDTSLSLLVTGRAGLIRLLLFSRRC